VALVARFELAEALRSKLLLVLLVLFMAGGAFGAWGYTKLVSWVESGAATAMGQDSKRSAKPGAMLGKLRESRSYADLVHMIVPEKEKADYYAALPPLVIFFGWAAFAFTPWLILFTSAETIASEVATRAIRFPLLRTSRLSYALGKGLGQAAIMVGVTAACGVMFFLVAWIRLASFEGPATLLGMVSYWPRILLYLLPILAWALFASMATTNANLARILSLGGGFALSIIAGIAAYRASLGGPLAVIWKGLGYLLPFGQRDGLEYPPGGHLPHDVIVCLVLTALYFGAGYAILRRRDV
jgi:ABC-type transport system involved in multi-copper enzyme maturation permease subunit